VAVAAAALHGQTYWSTDPNLDCTGTDGQTTVPLSGGGTGYACFQGGTFVWLAAGGSGTNTWKSYLRTAAPASAPIAVDYMFFDLSGSQQSLDTTAGTGSTVTSANELSFALNANQASQINLLGAAGTNHSSTITGSVWVTFLCPDAGTCQLADAQLIYSALPGFPWLLSAPLGYDYYFGSQFSGVGIDDNAANRVSIVVNNQDTTQTTASTFTVQVFDSNGNLAASGTTPPIAAVTLDSSGNFLQGGTYGALVSQIVTTKLPSGPFKVLIDGGGIAFSAEMLQFDGTSATSEAMAFDVSATLGTNASQQKAKTAAMRKARGQAAAQRISRRIQAQ